VHVKLTEEQSFQRYLKLGMPEHVAKILSSVEVASANGKSEMTNDIVEKVAGRPPHKFDAWVQENMMAWQ
jgi:hypothetical protein